MSVRKSRRVSLSRWALAGAAMLCLQGPPAFAQPSSPSPAALPEASPAVSPEASPEPEEDEVQFQGVLWNSYSVNFNNPSTGKNAFRGYDFDDRKLKMDMLELNTQYRVGVPDKVGFRLDLEGGGSMPRVDAASNLFRNEVTGLSNTDFDVRQAFLTYQSDFGLRVDAGKFTTIFGYEVTPGVDGLNPTATVAWSYTYSPFTHTGLRFVYPIDDVWTLTGLVVTGADTFTDNNAVPSVGAQLACKPCDEVSLVVNCLTGPERYQNDVDVRRLIDFAGSFQVTDEVKLGVHALTGIERFSRGLESPYTANWNSLVLYLETDITEEFSLNFRQEWFNDPYGVRTGVAQNLRGFTICPAYQVNEDLLLRLDFRIDRSSQSVFSKGQGTAFTQPTLYFNQVLRF